MSRFRQGQQWLKTKMRPKYNSSSGGDSPKKQQQQSRPQQRGIVIGHPTDFRRTDVTLGTDCKGRPVLIEQAREDAQAAFNASRAARAKQNML